MSFASSTLCLFAFSLRSVFVAKCYLAIKLHRTERKEKIAKIAIPPTVSKLMKDVPVRFNRLTQIRYLYFPSYGNVVKTALRNSMGPPSD
jgi:hypothetical protein